MLKGFKEPTYDQDYKKKDDDIALSLIQQGLDEIILPKILEASNAKEGWRIIETCWHGVGGKGVMQHLGCCAYSHGVVQGKDSAIGRK